MRKNQSKKTSVTKSETKKTKSELSKEIKSLQARLARTKKSEERNKKINNELVQFSKMLPLILNTIQQSVFWKDLNSKFLGCNKQFAKDAGLENPDDIVEKSDLDFKWRDRAEEYRRDDKEVIETGKPKLNYEEMQTKPDGSIRWLKTNKVPLFNKDGKIVGVLGSYEDITERKFTEEKLQHERQLLRTLIDNTPDAFYAKDTECRKTVANYVDLRNMGGIKTEAEVLGKTDFDFFPREIAENFHKDDLNVLAGNPVLNREEYFIDENGKKRWLLTSKIPTKDCDGNITGLVGIGRDITQKKEAEEAYHEATEQFQLIFDNAFDGMSIYDGNPDPSQRVLLDCNSSYAKIAGRSKEELLNIGKTYSIQNILSERKDESDRHTYRGSFSWIRPDGRDNVIEYAAVPIELHGKTFIIGIDRDVTIEKRAEEELRIERNLFKVLIDNQPDLIFYKGLNKKYILNNKAHLKFLGVETQEEALGKTIYDFRPADIADMYESDDDYVIATGEAIIGKERTVIIDDQEYWHISNRIPVKDNNGTLVGILGVSHDITNRKRDEEKLRQTYMELEKTNEDLEKANKVKSQFLANMSHEIRTPLNAIIGLTGLLIKTEMTDEQKDFVETIHSSGDILLSLINDILDFSKIEAQKIELEKQPFDLRLCIEEALDLVAFKATDKNIELLYSIDEKMQTSIIGDVTRLRQIIVNLLSNSIKFTETGEVVVSAEGQLLDNNRYQLKIAVKDTGLGIPIDRQNRLFQSFYQIDASTTRKFGGTGLGLAISKQLCELMGGKMWVESTGVPGEGTTFHFTIVTELSSEQTEQSDLSALSGKRLLIVDDNTTNQDILIRQTRVHDMIPVAVSSGHEALTLLNNGNGEPFDVVILDFHMPEMDGIMLAKEIRKTNRGKTLPLILLSSYGYWEKNSLTNFAAILTKPLKASLLYNALLTVLNKNGSLEARHVPAVEIYDIETGKRHPLRILLAEDNLINQKVAIRFLEKIGYKADIAFNGLEVLDALNRQVYDVILMDVQMPEMDGEQATIEIRRQFPDERQPRIVAMTANALSTDRERYLSVGMDGYIVKPFKMEELVKELLNVKPLIL
jgi:PAS domain S-box-containing protein